MKKITPIEIFILFLVLIGFAFYIVPKASLSLEEKQYGRMQTNTAMITSKILAEFSSTSNKKTPSEISKELTEEMNKLVKNPINKKNPAYSIDTECTGCVVIHPDDKIKNIVLTGNDKEGNLVVRTVIQPPSYVTYNKDFKQK